MPTEVLYVRIDIALKRELQRLSRESGMSLGDVSEIVIARGLKMEDKTSAARVRELIVERYGIADNGQNP